MTNQTEVGLNFEHVGLISADPFCKPTRRLNLEINFAVLFLTFSTMKFGIWAFRKNVKAFFWVWCCESFDKVFLDSHDCSHF